jgi:TRAP-type C4-dicarboxylate transport system permease small subunit
VVGHVGILLIGALVKFLSGSGASATQWLLCAVIVGLVGFGTCWGGATLADLYSGPMSFQ